MRVVTVLTTVSLLVLPTPQGPQLAGAVVTLGPSGEPIAGAVVELARTDNPANRQVTVADPAGRFFFEGLALGSYSLAASAPGYLRAEWGASALGGRGTTFALDRNTQMRDVRLRLSRGGTVSGMIMNPQGAPAPGVSVSLVPASGEGRKTTDSHGRYRFYAVPPGEYAVAAWVDQAVAEVGVVGQPPDIDAFLNAVRTGSPPKVQPTEAFSISRSYFPGTAVAGQAQRITIEAENDVAGIDFPLVQLGARTVRGRVLDPRGSPVAGARLYLRNDFGTASAVNGDNSGSFVFSGIVPGQYFVSTLVRQPEALWAEASVDVRAGDVDDVVLLLKEMSSLNGRIVLLAGHPADLMKTLTVHLKGPVSRRSSPSPDGRFVLSDLPPGAYYASLAGLPSGLSLRGVLVDGHDHLDRPIEIRDRPPDEVVLRVNDLKTELIGHITQHDGPADVFVVVIPTVREWWQASSGRLAVTRTSTDGRFRFAGLAPGDYHVAALASLDGWPSRDLLDTIVELSVRVSLRDGVPVSLQLKVH